MIHIYLYTILDTEPTMFVIDAATLLNEINGKTGII